MLQDDVPLALTFDDVLLVPRASSVLPRTVDTTTRLGRLELGIPLLSAAMDTLTEHRMAIAMAEAGGIGVLHKNLTLERQADEVRRVKEAGVICGAALGVGGDRDARLDALQAAGVDLVVLDTAHGHSQGVLDACRAIKDRCGAVLVVGNVATPEATEAVIEAGAEVVKVGVGPGSICTTRVVAGVGVPQLTAVASCARVTHGTDVQLIADGGVRTSGDVAKALAAGADAVMIGSLFAGCDEAPGEVVVMDGTRFKLYRGMGSVDAMLAGSSDRYFQEEQEAKKLVPEGVVARVPTKGRVQDVLDLLVGGLRSSMGYCGCPDIATFQRDTRFVRITNAGLTESRVHDVQT